MGADSPLPCRHHYGIFGARISPISASGRTSLLKIRSSAARSNCDWRTNRRLLAVVSPDVCGNGQGLLTTLFNQNWFSDEILAILLLKLVATAATFGSGAVGGVFT